MHTLRILHLSDLHERGGSESERWRRRQVLGDAWTENLRVVCEEDGPIDLVCFTGDVAHRGTEDEYAHATDFFAAVLAELGLGWDRFFAVPGNHDVHRATHQKTWRAIRKQLGALRPLEVSRWLMGGEVRGLLTDRHRVRLLERQAGYRRWLSSVGREALLPDPDLHPRLGYRQSVRLSADQPFDVHVVGLDSAWLCGDDNDSGKLRLTQDQIARLGSDPAGDPLPGFRLVLVHHPLSDLADRATARRMLSERADLLLRGHLHEPEAGIVGDPDGHGLRQLAAGCLYEGREADQYPNAYTVIRAELDDDGRPLRYDLRFRGWSRRGHWFDDGSLYRRAPGGRLTWGVAPGRAATRLHPLVAKVFVGREQELAELGRLLVTGAAEPRPVAICALAGMPGVGKSYLADRFAHLHGEAFPGGYVRLVLDPQAPRAAAALVAELADRLELPPGPDPGPAVRARLLSPRTLLHVENVDSDAAYVVAVRLLDQLAGCPVVLTGRLRDLGRGQGWPQVVVEPFTTETAVEQLGRELEGEPVAGESDAQRQLVDALGTLPLAIHLAAGHLRAGRTAAALLRRLERRGRLVEPAHGADVESRERARQLLDSTFAISLEVLEETLGHEANRLMPGLRALGHGPLTGFGPSLGAAIAGLDEDDFEELLFEARKASLVMPLPRGARSDGGWRIHPLVAELLGRESPLDQVLARITEWFVTRLPKGAAGEEEEQGRRWREVHAESRALAWWLPQVPAAERARVERAGVEYARGNGPFQPWLDFCEEALRGEVTDSERSHFLWTLGQVGLSGGFVDRALAAAREKVEVDTRRGAERDAALAWSLVADVAAARGELDEALRIRQEEALPVYEKLGDVRERAVTLGQIADVLAARGELDEALRIRQEEELPVYEKLGDVRELLVGRAKLALLLLLRRKQPGDRERAADLLAQALGDAVRLRIPEADQIRAILRRNGLEYEDPQ